MTKLYCEPNTPPRNWDEFLANAPDRSIAIDGYVIGPARFDGKRSVMNANHHEGVDRFSTRCTCAQLAIQIRTGLFQAFPGNDAINVFFNDCDQDVCSSIWLLSRPALSRGVISPILNRILFVEDMLDTTGGGYCFPLEMDGLMENNWIFQPYTVARENGALARRDPQEFINIIEAVGARIDLAVAGKGKYLPLDTKYDTLSWSSGWALVHEIGVNARTAMAADGIKAFVSVTSQGNGIYRYSIGRSGVWIPFDIPAIMDALNIAEGDPENLWGGSETIGGSPRATGSKLPPDTIVKIITEVTSRK